MVMHSEKPLDQQCELELKVQYLELEQFMSQQRKHSQFIEGHSEKDMTNSYEIIAVLQKVRQCFCCLFLCCRLSLASPACLSLH